MDLVALTSNIASVKYRFAIAFDEEHHSASTMIGLACQNVIWSNNDGFDTDIEQGYPQLSLWTQLDLCGGL